MSTPQFALDLRTLEGAVVLRGEYLTLELLFDAITALCDRFPERHLHLTSYDDGEVLGCAQLDQGVIYKCGCQDEI